jgi:hypothetical protein
MKLSPNTITIGIPCFIREKNRKPEYSFRDHPMNNLGKDFGKSEYAEKFVKDEKRIDSGYINQSISQDNSQKLFESQIQPEDSYRGHSLPPARSGPTHATNFDPYQASPNPNAGLKNEEKIAKNVNFPQYEQAVKGPERAGGVENYAAQ